MGAFGPNYGGNYARESVIFSAKSAYTLKVDLCLNNTAKSDLCVVIE